LSVATILFIKTAKFTLTVGATAVEFQGDAADVHVEVEAGETVDYPTLDGNVASNSAPETYSLVMRAGQDYSSTGLARFLWDNAGEIATVALNAFGQTTAAAAETPEVQGTVKLIPVQYGGEVSTFAEFEVTLPFTAKPVLATAPPVADDTKAKAKSAA
jgi:hypothetical protein